MLPGADVDCPPFLFPFFSTPTFPLFFFLGGGLLSPVTWPLSGVCVCTCKSTHLTRIGVERKKKNNLMRNLAALYKTSQSACNTWAERTTQTLVAGVLYVFILYLFFLFLSVCVLIDFTVVCLPPPTAASIHFFFNFLFRAAAHVPPRLSYKSAQCPAGTHPATQHLCSSLIAFYFFFPPSV